MEIGNVVEYIDRQRILCAVVLEVKNHRLRVLSETDREVKISAGRLSHRGGSRLDVDQGRIRLVEALKKIARRRKSLIEQVDIRELWEVLHSEQEWIDLTTMTAFCFPQNGGSDHESAVVRAFFHNRRYFKFNIDSFRPYTEEQVRQAVAQAEREARRARLVDAGGRWLHRLREDASAGSEGLEERDRSACLEALRSYCIHGKESPHQSVARAILGRGGIGSPEALFPLLVRAGVFAEEENLELLRLAVPTRFPEPVEARVATLSPIAGAGADRRDLTELSLTTIDGQSTLDFDDALSLESLGDLWRVGIHIVDVGHWVKRGDIVDAEARVRGSSVYMPDRKISMLPARLAENLCSLKAGEVRPAISILAVMDAQAVVHDVEIVASRVAVKNQLSYYAANQMMDDHPDLARLRDLAVAFRRRRLEDGAVQITLPDINVWLDGDGRITVARVNRESPARMLVAEMMILANWLVARFLAEKGLAAVFRSQAAPRERLYQGDQGSLFQNVMQRRLLSRFMLGASPERHAGLGLDAYVTATSPIRKYFDLVTQRQVRAALGREAPCSPEEITAVIADLQDPMRNVALLQRTRNRYWLLKHLEGCIGRKEEALVLFKRRQGYRILLTRYLLECDLPVSGGIELGTENVVQVTIQHVNARRDTFTVFLG